MPPFPLPRCWRSIHAFSQVTYIQLPPFKKFHYVPHTQHHRHSTSLTEYRNSSAGLALCSFHLGISLDANDIADVAVAALTDDRHVGQLYELTGPRLLTFPEAVEEISKAVGREIRYVQVSAEQYTSALEAELPPEFVWLVNYIFTTVLDGRNAHLTDGVQRALGREPRDFADYARDAAGSGIWGGVSR